jgi:hypothetical protein
MNKIIIIQLLHFVLFLIFDFFIYYKYNIIKILNNVGLKKVLLKIPKNVLWGGGGYYSVPTCIFVKMATLI